MDEIIAGVKKKYGEDAIVYLGSDSRLAHSLGFVSTGSFSVDYVIGRPGLPLGRVVEIYGPFSSGKSSIVASCVGSFQANGGKAVLFDGEHSFTPDWVKLFGVDPKKLLVCQPPNIHIMFEQAAYICDGLRRAAADEPVLIALDSLSAFPTPEELEFLEEKKPGAKEKARFTMALHARYCAKGLRVLTNLIWDSKVTLLVVSQLKDNPMNPYGGFKIGGEATNFHAAVQLKTIKQQKFTDKIRVKIRAEKNKVSPPFKEAILDIVFGQGIDDSHTFAHVAVDIGLVKQKGGGWYESEGKSFRMEDLVSKVGREVYKATFPELFPDEPVTEVITEEPKVEKPTEDPKVEEPKVEKLAEEPKVKEAPVVPKEEKESVPKEEVTEATG